MKPRWMLSVILVSATVLHGCEFGRRYVEKPWGKGTIIPAAVCAVAGGVGGAAIESEGFSGKSIRSGTSYVENSSGQRVSAHDDPAYAPAAAIGAVAGALVCGLVGHYLWDPEPTPPPPPPPTPTPELPPPSSQRIVLRGVNFDFDRTDIRLDSRAILDEALHVLKGYPDVRISVEGHTDALGSDEYNEHLSVRRAEATFRYLANYGIAPERMDVIGYGESRPVATNETEDGRAQNRRVELLVVRQPTGFDDGDPLPEPSPLLEPAAEPDN